MPIMRLANMAAAIAACALSSAVWGAVGRSMVHALNGETGAELLISILAGMTGGIANLCWRLQDTAYFVKSWRRELTAILVVSTFAAAMTYLLSESYGISDLLQLFLISLAGWGGGAFVSAMVDSARRRIKKIIDPDTSAEP